MIKTLNNVEIEGSFLNLIKNSYKKEKKSIANIKLTREMSDLSH